MDAAARIAEGKTMSLATIIAFGTGFALHWAIVRGNLPIMRNMTFAKSAALWLAIFAGLCAFTAGIQWLVDAGAL